MTLLPLGLAVAAALCWPVRKGAGDRLRALGTAPTTEVAAPAAALRTRFVLGAVVAVAAAVVMGMPLWVPAAGLAALLAGGWRRSRRAEPRGDVPLVADLMASCLAAGVGMPAAIRAARSAAGPAVAPLLDEVAGRLERGGSDAQAWAPWLADPELAALGRTCLRTSRTGAAAAPEITRAAERLRMRGNAEAQRRIARAGVWVVLPLGLCFLPAFVLVGVVPVAVGLLQHLH